MTTYSVTERIEWLRCRRAHRYGSFNGLALSPIIPPLVLNMGTVWHKGHEAWSKNPKIDFRSHIRIEGANILYNMRQNYKQVVGVMPSDEELYKFIEGMQLLEFLAERYQGYWRTSVPKGMRKLGTEVTAIVSVQGTPHNYEGTFDGLLIDNAGLLWIGEFKTFDRHPNFADLTKTEQFLDYMWILRQAILQGQIEAKGVGGMLYDGTWKRDTKPVDELFTRKKLTRPESELNAHEETIAICLNEMGADKFNGLHHPVYNRYYTCTNCKFEPLCAAVMRGEKPEEIMRIKYIPREKQGFALVEHENFA